MRTWLIVVGVMAGAWLPADAWSGSTSVFGHAGRVAPEELVLPEWQRVLSKIGAETPIYDACSRSLNSCPSPEAREWLTLLKKIAGESHLEQLLAVNNFANNRPYKTDQLNYKYRDYWASPLEFLNNSGDCEDYAIFKYISLRRLGMPAHALRIVVVQDLNRDMAHAVLLADLDKKIYVLDNLNNNLTNMDSVKSYVPFYAVNETTRWAYDSMLFRVAGEKNLSNLGIKPSSRTTD